MTIIDEIREAKAGATPGPWEWHGQALWEKLAQDIRGDIVGEAYIASDSDRDLIALAPRMAEALLAADEMAEALKRLEYWFDTDEELLLSMTGPERFDHERQHNMIRNALAAFREATK